MSAEPARTPHPEDWKPNRGPQERFLSLTCFEALYGGAAGGGKLLWTGEVLPTPKGFVALKDLRPGDSVFGRDGKPCTILGESELVYAPAYRLTFDDGATVIAHDDHLWLTFDAKELGMILRRDPAWKAKRRANRPSRAGSNKTASFREAIALRNAARSACTATLPPPSGTVRATSEIVATLKTRGGRNNHAVPVCGALDLPDATLPIDPYVLGAWLGDGTTLAPTITSMDPEIIQSVVDAGFPVMTRSDKADSKASGYSFRGLRAPLKAMGLIGNKHIPDVYLWASAAQRLALLQGLMDTDGGVESGSASFTSTKQVLAEGVAHLARSLGNKATVREGKAVLRGRVIGPKWTVKFRPNCQVFRLERKASKLQLAQRQTTRFRYIVSAERVEPCELKCIKVSADDGLFLATKDLVPTHNSDAILVDAVRYVGRGYGPAYKALLLRRTFPSLEKSLIGRSHALYPRIGGRYNEAKKTWSFPQGERLFFGYLEHENDVEQYQGGEFPYIGFDELTQFSLAQYLYLFSRCRSGVVPCRIRGTTNPGGTGHEWVYERFGPWLDPKSEVRAAPGQVLYFIKESGQDVCVPKGTLDKKGTKALGRVFVPAKLDDNPYLANDGFYARALEELDPVTQAQLKDGNWLIKPGKGLYFKGDWVSYIDEPPPGLRWVRSWDLAATPKTKENDPDWTQGVLGALWENKIVLGDLRSLQGDPGDVESLILSTADMDGKSIRIRLPQDPAQAGKSQAFNFARLLRGYDFRTKVNTGDKITRFGPFSAQAKQKNVVLVRGRWNARLVSELEGFPDGKKDIADAISDLYDELISGGAMAVRPPSSKSTRWGSSGRGY